MRRAILSILLTAVPAAAVAQDGISRPAPTSIGQPGQREARSNTVEGIELSARIQNRVQSRIRNRIDRYYNPQANATAPFAVAGDQLRTAGRRAR